MKKIIFLFSLVVTLLLPSALNAQTNDKNWVKLGDIIGENYKRYSWGYNNASLEKPENLIFLIK